jgi:uncharacterized protein
MANPNRLAGELSPYLLQHAHNPVDWRPWSPEAFEEAARRDVPVLVSIGYSACHWCHVMERESFEDDATAGWMNEHMVCVKVDREERPDLDALYMDYVVSMRGQGGWPLNVFVSPERIPIWGGTYFPPLARGGMPSWLEVCAAISKGWKQEKDRIRLGAEDLAARLSGASRLEIGAIPSGGVLRTAISRQILSMDPVWGGFPGAPKFPPHAFLATSLQEPHLSGPERESLSVALDRMALGGIRDHVGGGFCRYSTDERWLVPHFEKMLYDNAQLLGVYARASVVLENPWYGEVVRDTVEWMDRELGEPGGGFRSALDADSEGEEGKFYVWTWEELEEHLKEDRDDFARIWNASPSGNFEGANILWRQRAPGAYADDPRWARWRSRLISARASRIRPGLDDKVLASWNGLAMGGLARSGRILSDPALVARARDVAEFVLGRLRHEGGLWSVWKDGGTRHPGTLEDWAFLGDGFLELWQADGDGRWLTAAVDFARQILERFADPDVAALRMSDRERDDLFAPVVPLQDGATPSGNGVAARLFAALWHLTGEDLFRRHAESILSVCADGMARFPRAFASALDAARILSESALLVHLDGDPESAQRKAMDNLLCRVPTSLLVRTHGGESPPELRGGFAGDHPRSPTARAWICRGSACLAPATTLEELGERLSGAA